LARNELTGMRAARFKMMSRLGAVPSDRDSNFPVVFQHDSPLFPEQCGGPICDLQGNVLGINIARESRAASYAIPANHVRTILERFLD
jgi:serine protease Do